MVNFCSLRYLDVICWLIYYISRVDLLIVLNKVVLYDDVEDDDSLVF